MRKHLLPVILLLCTFGIQSIGSQFTLCHAQTRRYEAYKTDRFGNKRNILRPEAVIEIDESTDTARMYDTDKYGFADIISEPTYVIESSPFNSLRGSSLSSDEDCDHGHDELHRRHRDDDDDDDNKDHEEF